MTRGSKAVVVALVVLAALVGGVGHAGASTAVAAQEDCSFPVTTTDATGTDVTLEEPPEEIVALGASSAQTIWELGEEDRVVGMPVDQSTSSLEGSDGRTHVLDGVRVDVEAVVDLDPDLVIAPSIIAPEDVEALRDAGLTVYREDHAASIEAIRGNTRAAGQLLGACDEAEDTVEWMDERLSVVEESIEGEERPTVFYWLGGGYTAGSGTFQGQLLETAGAENAAANVGVEGWTAAEPEAIVAEDPDYILVSEDTQLPEDHPIQETTAAQEDDVVTVDANDWNQAAPRIVLAVEEITQQLHNESYEEATSDAEEDGLPGFGAPAAAAALLGAVLVLRRRA